MSSDLTWPILFVAAALTLFIIEVFIPSGGLIGVLAIGLLLVGIWKAFQVSTATGMKFSIAVLMLLPVAFVVAVQLWPRTPMAKWAFLKPPTREEIEPDRGARLELLIGQFGRAVSPLRPSGLVDFDGRRLDGLSEEGLIPAGALVRAVGVRGQAIVVRAATDPSLDDLIS
jgi:membrane-bound ClpP family serine protease